MNILVSLATGIQKIFFTDELKDMLATLGNVTYNTGTNYTPEQMQALLKDTDIVITGWGQTKITGDIAGDRLKLIAHVGGSVGSIVDASTYTKNIKVVSANDIFAKSVAEGVLSYILSELRNLNYYASSFKSGVWTTNGDLKTRSLHGKTVGIVSIGAISTQLLALLSPFDINIKVFSTNKDMELKKKHGYIYTSLEDVFSTCDIVTIHTAANEETKHMVSKELMQAMKPGSVLVNTSRGSVVDEDGLIQVLEEGKISAVLDVYTVEPLPAESKLYSLPNVTIFPHMAGPASDLKYYITEQILLDVSRFMQDTVLLHEINEETALSMTQTK